MAMAAPIAMTTIEPDIMTDRYRDMMILQAWFSPAFPTGAFSYSHGLETAIQQGMIDDAATLQDWIAALLSHGSGWNDALLIKAAYEGEPEVNTLSLSLSAGKERHQETAELGQAFVRVVNASHGAGLPDGLTYPVAFGQAAQQMQIDLSLAIQCYLQAFAANLISVGVRTIPIGQQAGQKCLVNLYGTIAQVVETCRNATLDQLGGATQMADLMAMKHEHSTPRIYRT